MNCIFIKKVADTTINKKSIKFGIERIGNESYILEVKISEKISQVKTITYDLLNEDQLDKKLSIKDVTLDRSEIIVKGSEETINLSIFFVTTILTTTASSKISPLSSMKRQ